MQAQKSSNSQGDEAPAWAPLRDNYMLANQKLKDWDKKQVSFILIHISELRGLYTNIQMYNGCLMFEFLQETNEGDDFGAMSDESYED